MCAPEPTLPASRSGANVARRPPRRATSRTTSLVTTLRSAAATPSAGATGTSNWCSPYSGRKSSGSTPAARSAAIVCDGNGSARRCASSDIAGAGGLSSSSTNSCSKDARTRSPACRCSRSSALRRNVRPQPSQSLPSTCPMSQSTRCSGAIPGQWSTRTRVAGSGRSLTSPADPQGFGSASSPNAEIDWFAGTQPTPISRRRSRSARGTERPRTSPARSHVTRLTSSSPTPGSTVKLKSSVYASPSHCAAGCWSANVRAMSLRRANQTSPSPRA